MHLDNVFFVAAIFIPSVDSIPVNFESNELILLSPNDVQPQLNLSCTVEAEGSFQWQWTGPGDIISFANANRTSFFSMSQISADTSGHFLCEASYTHNTERTGSRNFTIGFDPCKFSVYPGPI